jgi:hypothetical protein
MKNILIGLFVPIAFVVLSTNNLNAQWDNDRVFFGGIIAGANLSQVSGDAIEGYRKIGANFGAVTFFKLQDNIYGSMELLYNEKGSRYWHGVDPIYQSTTGKVYKKYGIVLPYAEIPLMLSYFDKKGSNAGMGLSYGQLFREKEYLDSARLETAFPFRKHDVNLILNGNLALTKNLFFNMRFNYSLINIRKVHNVNLDHRVQQYSRLFTFRMMYIF